MRRSHRLPRLVKWFGLGAAFVVLGFWVHSAFAALQLNLFARNFFALQVVSTWGCIQVFFYTPIIGYSVESIRELLR